MNLKKRFQILGNTPKGGLLFFLVATLATVIWVQIPNAKPMITPISHSTPTPKPQIRTTTNRSTGVKVTADLSHPMIVRGDNGNIFINFNVETPSLSGITTKRVPTDMIVILDRSGSMNDDNKWRYATSAVRDLVNRLHSNDRIAFISFDSYARIEHRLAWADTNTKRSIQHRLRQLRPGNSTNLGHGLTTAEGIAARARKKERNTRIILLSDGEANAGITNPASLNQMAKRLAERNAVVSTIGMGLGFNETLMASLADNGMGNFSFLESLESLASIFAKELNESRDVYASGSELTIKLPEGASLVDAAGYPIERRGHQAIIRTGALRQDAIKNFMITVKIPNHRIASYKIDNVELNYTVKNEHFKQRLSGKPFVISCVKPERRKDVIASVNKKVYADGVLKARYGLMQRKLSTRIGQGLGTKGRGGGARGAINEYKRELADYGANMPEIQVLAGKAVAEAEADFDEAFTGKNQKTKQSRKAKELLQRSNELQRSVTKK